jgi:hypothetical protein
VNKKILNDMIEIKINTVSKIRNYIDDKYDDLLYYNGFKSGTTLSITDENGQVYGFINDEIETPVFIPNKDIGFASESFIKYLEYKGINSIDIKIENEIKTIYQNKPKLKIERYNIDDVYNFDFSIILAKDEAIIHKGKKIQQDYVDKNGDVIVSKYYQDVIGDRIIFGEISSNRLIGLQIKIIWWTENNEIGLEKIVEVKKFSRQEEGERLKNYRARQIDNLKGLAMGTDAEPVVDAIYEYYDSDIYKYINHGTGEFLSSLTYETDPTINYYLGIEIPKIITYDFLETDFYLSGSNYFVDIEMNYYNCIIKMNNQISGKMNDIDISTEIIDKDNVKYFKNKILDTSFIPEDKEYTFIFYNTIKDYILHEIDPDIA